MATFSTERYLHNTELQKSMVAGTVSAPSVIHKFASATAVKAGDILLVAKLTERTALLGIEMLTTALGAGITADVGILNEDETDMSARFLTGASLAAQKWFKVGDNVIDGRLVKVRNDISTIAIKFTAAGTIAKDAQIIVTPWYRHATNAE